MYRQNLPERWEVQATELSLDQGKREFTAGICTLCWCPNSWASDCFGDQLEKSWCHPKPDGNCTVNLQFCRQEESFSLQIISCFYRNYPLGMYSCQFKLFSVVPKDLSMEKNIFWCYTLDILLLCTIAYKYLLPWSLSWLRGHTDPWDQGPVVEPNLEKGLQNKGYDHFIVDIVNVHKEI